MFSIGELFSFEPLLSYEILAGWAGRDHVFKMELFLAINLQQIDLVNLLECIDSTPAGLLLYGSSCPILGPQVNELADIKKVPVLYCSSEDAPSQIRDLYPVIAELSKSGKLYQFAQNAIYSFMRGKDPSALCSFLQRRLNNPVVVFNNVFQEIYSGFQEENGPKALGDRIPENFMEYCCRQERDQWEDDSFAEGSRHNILLFEDDQKLSYIMMPLSDQGYRYGFLAVFEQNSPISTLDMIYLESGKKILLEQLIQRRNLDSIENKHKADFIYDLLYNNFESKQEIINRGKYWGFDLSSPHQLFVLEPDSAEETRSLQELMDKIQMIACDALRLAHCQPIIGQIQDQIVLIIPEKSFREHTINKDTSFSLASSLHKKLKTYLPAVSFAIGIGRFYHSILDLSRSFQEAKISLELGKIIYDKNHIAHFEDLGIVRLLASIDFIQLEEFYREYLTEVIIYDQQNEGNLLETLLLYFKYNGDVNVIAQKMFIHPNSLRYRLKKIEELTLTDLRNYEDMLNLFIACKIAVMKEKFEK
ncbi:MAG: hypothetical protein GX434_02140 [Peptococcaceae bacterium]|nr:hypothetical protein [Peptococcaceae bacterium]